PDVRAALSAALAAALRGSVPLPPVVGAADTLADPKDDPQAVETYRAAIQLIGDRKWAEALALLQTTVHKVPAADEIWAQLADTAALLNRYHVALDAYSHLAELKPNDPAGPLGAADILLRERRLEDARTEAA